MHRCGAKIKPEALNIQDFENVLDALCKALTAECKKKKFDKSEVFERRVREVLQPLIKQYQLPVDFAPHPYGFPDIVLGDFGIEVKFTTNDTWRSVANSVFERFRRDEVKQIYVVFGKMGGSRGVRWGRYEDLQDPTACDVSCQ
jgi:hypothetical protein